VRIYLSRIEMHDALFYATREIGRLYETGPHLHNYALSYAFELATAPLVCLESVPHYEEELGPLNDRGIYVTPALGVDIHYRMRTFKYGSERRSAAPGAERTNTPSFGRAKEIALGSTFQCALFSAHGPLSLPHWIRLGLWRSIAEVTWEEFDVEPTEGPYVASLPLNPLDVPGTLREYQLVSMPPSSLVLDAALEGPHYELPTPDRLQLPAGMLYFLHAPPAPAAANGKKK
jgi:CRISPR-associated protein Csc1